MPALWKTAVLFCVFVLLACETRKDGAVEGVVDPPGSQARIAALSKGEEVKSVPSTGADGRFRLALAPGTYTITVAAPGSSFPLRFDDVVVKPGEATPLPPVSLGAAGSARLSGKVIPAKQGSEVILLYEGRERAAVRTDSEGRYEFKEIPAGTYEVRASLPGYADDRAPVAVGQDRNIEHTALLLPVTEIDGVDWAAGTIRARGVGLPPQEAPNRTVRSAMAERAALADGVRNLLRTVEQIRLDSGQDVRTAMANPDFAVRIQGFVKGYIVAGKRELEDGKVEMILELPLTGPNGLSRHMLEAVR